MMEKIGEAGTLEEKEEFVKYVGNASEDMIEEAIRRDKKMQEGSVDSKRKRHYDEDEQAIEGKFKRVEEDCSDSDVAILDSGNSSSSDLNPNPSPPGVKMEIGIPI